MKLIPLMTLIGRFDTPGDPRYAWLLRTVAVGEGRMHPDCVEYAIFEVARA
jgi:hypothetical protein